MPGSLGGLDESEGQKQQAEGTQRDPRDVDLERDHPGTPAYDDLAQLASAGVDAVAISTPADTHVPLVLEAVSLGLPVVCDKPFALHSAAARDTLEEAGRAGVLLTVYRRRADGGRLPGGLRRRVGGSAARAVGPPACRAHEQAVAK